jgi:hypothetical protein
MYPHTARSYSTRPQAALALHIVLTLLSALLPKESSDGKVRGVPTIPCHGCLDLGSKQTKTNRTHNQTNQQERRSARRQPPKACMHVLAHSALARACGCVGCPAQARLQRIKCARRLRWRAIIFVTCGTSHVARRILHVACNAILAKVGLLAVCACAWRASSTRMRRSGGGAGRSAACRMVPHA